MVLTTLDLFSLTGVNNKDRSGKTPLHTAILSKQFKVVDMLLQYGADVTVTDDAGDTPLHTAIYVGSERLVMVSISAIIVTSHFSFFCSTNASVSFLLFGISCLSHVLFQKTLLRQAGTDVNALGRGSCTPLHLAAEMDNDAICKILVSHSHLYLSP